QLFERQSLLSRPRVYQRKVVQSCRAFDCVPTRRKQRPSLLAFPNGRFLVAECGINHAKNTYRFGIIRLVGNNLINGEARLLKISLCRDLIAPCFCQYPVAPNAREWETFTATSIGTQSSKSALGCC